MPNNRGIWLSIMTLAATMVGTATGILSWIGGASPALALVAGSGAFATTILLMITMKDFLDHDPEPPGGLPDRRHAGRES
jgi:hypothetical protein